MSKTINRRDFLKAMGVAAGSMLINPAMALGNLDAAAPAQQGRKKKLAMVGTGSRGIGMWGTPVITRYGDRVEFVGLCDPNLGRVNTAKRLMNLDCPTYTDFDKMMQEVKPDVLIVTTVDAFHSDYIVKGMEYGADIITEKPMTTDETKCQAIIDAEKKTGKKVTVTFNYRYSPHREKMWELIRQGAIGKVTSVDFHWYLDTSHGADYFRRWHRKREFGGTLWVHKATHHFDLLNYWLDSEPEEVFAMGALEFYGKNGPYRADNCRECSHTRECKFYFDVMRGRNKELYVDNEQYDGYKRDGCVFKNDIDIFDKMAATIRYANGTQVSYSLTTYSPYEGYRIAFNGTEGRMEAWIQESNPTFSANYDEIMVTRDRSGLRDYYRISHNAALGGHGGGDNRMLDKIFLETPGDPYKQSAGVRDGAFSILVGVAARKSCDSGQPIKIADLTSLKPMAQKP